MIRLQSVHIEEFRGIRDLTLSLNGENFGIYGPNGTGKSGVVDAIEFCLTGSITRLSGSGTKELSVKSHAPHVDKRDHPEQAKVTINAEIPTLNKTVTLERSVKDARNLRLSSSDADVLEVITELQNHPEFALSRREIAKYIITPPGQRSDDVQHLLRLDYIEGLRKSLRTFANKRTNEANAANRILKNAAKDLCDLLEIEKLGQDSILAQVNEWRELLGLEPIPETAVDTRLNTGVSTLQKDETKETLNKETALQDIEKMQSAASEKVPDLLTENQEKVEERLTALLEDGNAIQEARRTGFLQTGIELITDDACPLCDTPWEQTELREHLQAKIQSAQEVQQILSDINGAINVILESLEQRLTLVNRILGYIDTLESDFDHSAITGYIERLQSLQETLQSFLQDPEDYEAIIDALSESWWTPDQATQETVQTCQEAVDALPEPSEEDQARQNLILAQERYEKYRKAQSTAAKMEARETTATKILEHYIKVSTTELEEIYDAVAEDFAQYYRFINGEDEEHFKGELKAGPAKLDFDVDFYGRGLFPPGAYHSEGHQDGMGLCLYLALMKHTLGNDFTFAVLDDVMMSIDASHRREVCQLLQQEFPQTQFIVTTHDRVWLQYMKTEHLVERSKEFGSWDVDTGPKVWDDTDVWTDIAGDLQRNRVSDAAATLRRYLEYNAHVLAHRLQAEVVFRGDGRYTLGDLMPKVLKRWKKILLKGQEVAQKWDQSEKEEEIADRYSDAKDLIRNTNVERWVVNPSVHYNEWANFEGPEFQKVVDAFQALFIHMRCDKCQSFPYITPNHGSPDDLRCNCDDFHINLNDREK